MDPSYFKDPRTGMLLVALWGVGIGGGYHLAFNGAGALGFWWSATFGLLLAAALLSALQIWVERSLIKQRAS